MIYYFSLISLVYFMRLSFSRNHGIALLATLTVYGVLIIFSGLRVDAGYDYGSYVQLLESGAFLLLFEPIPSLYGLFAWFTKSPQLFFVLNAITLAFGLYLFINKERSRAVFFALYFALPFCLIDSFSLVRQYLAASFILAGFALYGKHRVLSICFLLLAVLSHKTALPAALIIIFALLSYKFLLRQVWIMMLVGPVSIGIITFFAIPYVGFFDVENNISTVGLKGFAVWIFMFMIAVVGIKRYLRTYSDPVVMIALLGLGIYAGLALYGYFASRFFVYFAPFAALFVARSFRIQFGRYATWVALAIAMINLTGLLYGSAHHPEFDFLNDYKFYPAECSNCNIRAPGVDGGI